MILSVVRPYFAPYPGYFYQAHLADVLVLLDRVQFPRRTTWINRNRLKNDQGSLWLTVPVRKKHRGLQRIDQVRICYDGQWSAKVFASLEHAYRHAPYYTDHRAFLAGEFSGRVDTLLELNLAILRHLLDCLRIDARLVMQSDLNTREKGDRLLPEICRLTKASTLIVPRDILKHIDPLDFEESGVGIKCVSIPKPVYPQLWGNFIANLSTFDLVFNCGPRAREILLGC